METVWLIVVMVLAASTIYFGVLAACCHEWRLLESNAHDSTREHRDALLEELALMKKECEQAKADRIATEKQLNDLSLKYDGLSGMLGRIQDVLDEDEDEDESEWE